MEILRLILTIAITTSVATGVLVVGAFLLARRKEEREMEQAALRKRNTASAMQPRPGPMTRPYPVGQLPPPADPRQTPRSYPGPPPRPVQPPYEHRQVQRPQRPQPPRR